SRVEISGGIGGGSLARRPTRRRGEGLQLRDGTRRAVLGAGHPGDGLLHERAAEVVHATVEQRDGALVAELDPGALDVGDPAVQQDPGHRVYRPVLPPAGPGAGDAGEVERRVLVDER